MTTVPLAPFEPDKSRFNTAATPEITNAVPTADGWGPLQGTTIVFGVYFPLANELLHESLLDSEGNPKYIVSTVTSENVQMINAMLVNPPLGAITL